MADQRLPDAAKSGQSTGNTRPEHDGKPRPNSGLERRQEANSKVTEQAQSEGQAAGHGRAK